MGAITHKNIKDNIKIKRGMCHAGSGDVLSSLLLISESCVTSLKRRNTVQL